MCKAKTATSSTSRQLSNQEQARRNTAYILKKPSANPFVGKAQKIELVFIHLSPKQPFAAGMFCRIVGDYL
jgi:hypothetical protein